MFGADVDNCVASQRLTEIPSLNDAYEQWYHYWLGTLTFSETSHPFTRRIFDLYYYSAKLYLFSHVFRGQAPDLNDSTLANQAINDAKQFADAALKSALSIVCLITKEDGLRNLPYYLGTVTAFASVCLVKASTQSELMICDKDGDDVSQHLHQLVQVLRLSAAAGDQSIHPLHGIAESLENILIGGPEINGPLNEIFGLGFPFEGIDMLPGDFEQTLQPF